MGYGVARNMLISKENGFSKRKHPLKQQQDSNMKRSMVVLLSKNEAKIEQT
jgi:hypothetical protein